jgi:hypothetical protein
MQPFLSHRRKGFRAKATGGVEYKFGSYTVHVFLSNGDFEVLPGDGLTCDVLVVAGAGSGGRYSGGGGAGGLIYHSGRSIAQGTHSAVIGAGGVQGYTYQGTVGEDTTFNSLTAKGGGYAGGQTVVGGVGGSGGGGGYDNLSGNDKAGGASNQSSVGGDSSTYGFGNAGGQGHTHTQWGIYAGGGGGGAGAAGVDGIADPGTRIAGNGGVGKDYSTVFGTTYGESGWFAGGGGSLIQAGAGFTGGVGGVGGGGDGSLSGCGDAGMANTGGGGGGGHGWASCGTGGSGIVIIRYL